jgi:hypothetical protein
MAHSSKSLFDTVGHHTYFVGLPPREDDLIVRIVRIIRLELSGALFFIAATGVISSIFGMTSSLGVDLMAALLRFDCYVSSYWIMIEQLTSIKALTMLVGFLVVIIKIIIRFQSGHQPCVSRGKCSADLLNGTILVPFFVITMSVFSDTLLLDLVKNGTAFLSMAGAIGGFFVLGEILKAESPRSP